MTKDKEVRQYSSEKPEKYTILQDADILLNISIMIYFVSFSFQHPVVVSRLEMEIALQ